MSDEIKHVHARIPMDKYLEADAKLKRRGESWQTFILGKVEKLINPGKKKKKGNYPFKTNRTKQR